MKKAEAASHACENMLQCRTCAALGRVSALCDTGVTFRRVEPRGDVPWTEVVVAGPVVARHMTELGYLTPPAALPELDPGDLDPSGERPHAGPPAWQEVLKNGVLTCRPAPLYKRGSSGESDVVRAVGALATNMLWTTSWALSLHLAPFPSMVVLETYCWARGPYARAVTDAVDTFWGEQGLVSDSLDPSRLKSRLKIFLNLRLFEVWRGSFAFPPPPPPRFSAAWPLKWPCRGGTATGGTAV